MDRLGDLARARDRLGDVRARVEIEAHDVGIGDGRAARIERRAGPAPPSGSDASAV